MPAQSTAQQHFPPGYLEEYRGNEVITYSIVFLTLGTFFVALRFWSRSLGKVAWGWDDTFLVGSAFYVLAVIVTCICDVIYGGVGWHAARIVKDDPHKLIVWAKFVFVFPLVYVPAAALPKLSIMALYFRVFGTKTNPISRLICWITSAIIVANCIANLLVTFFMCRPIAFLWNKHIIGGTCLDINSWWRWASLANIVTDVVVLALPVPTILALQAPKKVKVGLAVTFITASIGLVTAIIRFRDFFTNDFSADPTWTAATLLIVTIAEPGLYLIAACLVALRPLLKWSVEKVPITSMTFKTGQSSSQHADTDQYIMQKRSFKVTANERFEPLDDSEELIDTNHLGKQQSKLGQH